MDTAKKSTQQFGAKGKRVDFKELLRIEVDSGS
jgi:hypothetical protein